MSITSRASTTSTATPSATRSELELPGEDPVLGVAREARSRRVLDLDFHVGKLGHRHVLRELDLLGAREVVLQLDPVRVVEALRALEDALVAVDLLQDRALH